jgi:hypothetical protein
VKQEDTDKNRAEKVPLSAVPNTAQPGLKILIPALNEYPLKNIKHWVKQVYHQARIKVGWRKAKKIKQTMPIETAAYAEDKVFGNWRLVAPDGPDKISPLQKVITLIRDEIVPTRWGQFRREFVREIKIDFNAICESDYDPKMVDEVNERLNQLLSKYTRWATTPQPPLLRGSNGENPPYQRGTKGVVINFILKPETAEDRSSLKNLTIMSGIWMRWTGKPLDFSQFIKPPGAKPICRQMEMYLDLSVM